MSDHLQSSHVQRWVTGLLVGLPLLALLCFGPFWTWLLIVALAAGAGMWELQRFLFPESLSDEWRIFYISVGLLLPLGAFLGGATGLHCALVMGLFAALAALLIRFPDAADGIGRMARFMLAWTYISYLLSYALLLGLQEDGRAWTIFVLVVAVACDAGAFYTGRNWGRRKLYEAVSPKKTVEGAGGGFGASLLAGLFYGSFFLQGASAGLLALMSLAVALVGQAGDLMESMIKRLSGRKDSSHLLPGHGGMLDRLDSLLFAFPTAWFLLQWL